MKQLASREIKVQDCLMVHMVEEEVAPSEMTALECVLSADTELKALQEKLETEMAKEEPNLKLIEKLNERLEEIDADTAETRSAEILAGLGFTSETMEKKCKDFSGGWRMRISIA